MASEPGRQVRKEAQMSEIKFETINGQLCRMVEPTPLTPDSKMPCVVSRREDGEIGLYTKMYFSELIGQKLVVNELDRDICVFSDNTWTICELPYLYFEIIGYPVVEGSKEWALCMMQKGYTVCPAELPQGIKHLRHVFGIIGWGYEVIDYNTGDKFSQEKWMERTTNTGRWQIYEPESEPNVGNPETTYQVTITDRKWKGLSQTWSGVPYHEADRIADALNHVSSPITKPEPEPELKVGDWVEVNVNGERKQGKLVRFCSADFMQDNHYAFALHDCFGKWYGYHRVSSITRKLSPSDVIVHIGCLSGTVHKLDKTFFVLDPAQEKGQLNPVAKIPIDMLDTQTRELVESLLKAQEKK